MKKIVSATLAMLLTMALICGCSAAPAKGTEKPAPAGTATDVISRTSGIEKLDVLTDYSDKNNWMAFPENGDKAVDVIYFYPTAYSKSAATDSDICDIDNAAMREQANVVMKLQASVFEESCNVYAPYYRQVDGAHALTVSDDDNLTLMRYCASKDPAAALDYYFEHCNNGRSYILAGHSQGSEILIMLLADYMKEHPDYYKSMVAAYPIGYSVTKDYLAANPHLKFAAGADDTGVIISYNTEGPGNKNEKNVLVREGAISINPINWRLDDTYAPASENLGALQSDGTLASGFADARVDVARGVVVCESVDYAKYAMPPETAALFGPQSYHGNDYGFYYINLRENVKARIAAFAK